jgi:hypothetical protein
MATTQKFKMLPSFYQACLQANLSEAQYLTLQIFILLLLSSQNGTIREISWPISSTNYLW